MPIPFDFEKKVYSSINRIESFNKEKAFRIMESEFPIGNSIATISKEENSGFICKIYLDKLYDHNYIERFGVFEPIILESSSGKYFISKKSVKSVDLALSYPQVITLHIDDFQSGLPEDFNDKLHRLVIPVEVEPTFNIIEFCSLKIKDCTMVCGLLKVTIQGYNYHIFKYKNDDTKKKFIIIDGIEKNSFQEFKTNCNSIMTGFGYVSGNLYLDEYYYQTIREKEPEFIDEILYEKKEKSALTDYVLLDPFRFREYIDTIGKKNEVKDIRSNMKNEVFSNLCTIIKTNEIFARCCQLIIEGNQSKQLLLRAGIYSIALETLTTIIYEENQEKLNPIKEKKLAKLIREKFMTIIKEYDEFISPYGLKIIESKINDLNKPTNAKKLSMPFEIYNLKLNQDDLNILNHRNKFLHGSTPFDEVDLKDKEDELRFIIARLNYMLNSLMLKYIGYSGHIVNYPAWMQFNKNEKVTDHLFRII